MSMLSDRCIDFGSEIDKQLQEQDKRDFEGWIKKQEKKRKWQYKCDMHGDDIMRDDNDPEPPSEPPSDLYSEPEPASKKIYYGHGGFRDARSPLAACLSVANCTQNMILGEVGHRRGRARREGWVAIGRGEEQPRVLGLGHRVDRGHVGHHV